MDRDRPVFKASDLAAWFNQEGGEVDKLEVAGARTPDQIAGMREVLGDLAAYFITCVDLQTGKFDERLRDEGKS